MLTRLNERRITPFIQKARSLNRYMVINYRLLSYVIVWLMLTALIAEQYLNIPLGTALVLLALALTYTQTTYILALTPAPPEPEQ